MGGDSRLRVWRFHSTRIALLLNGARVRTGSSEAEGDGGYQAFAVDPAGKYIVAAMHDKGVEGSHKRPAKQLWVHELAGGKRVATVPGRGAVSLTFSHNGQRLHSLNGETGEMVVWQWSGAGALKPSLTVKRAGESAIQLESHD